MSGQVVVYSECDQARTVTDHDARLRWRVPDRQINQIEMRQQAEREARFRAQVEINRRRSAAIAMLPAADEQAAEDLEYAQRFVRTWLPELFGYRGLF